MIYIYIYICIYTQIVVLRKAGNAPGHTPVVGFLHLHLYLQGQ